MRRVKKALSQEGMADLGKTLFSTLLMPKGTLQSNVGLTERNLRASLERSGIGAYLFYESYDDMGGGVGIYRMADGRKGFVLRIYPPPFLGAKIEKLIRTLLNEIRINDTVVHFNTYASRNIDEYLMEYKKIHHGKSNVRNPKVLEEYVDNRIKAYRRWTNESMLSGVDFRIRDFVNLISISVPESVPDRELVVMHNQFASMMSDYGAENFDAGRLISMLQEILNPHLDGWDPFMDRNQEINDQIAIPGTRVTIDDEKRCFHLGDPKAGWMGMTLTTQSYPSELSIAEFQEIFFRPLGQVQAPLPCPFMISLVIHFEDMDKMADETVSAAKDDIKELRRVNAKDRASNPDVKERYDEAVRTIELVRHYSEVPVRAMWAMTIFENDEAKLDRYVAAVRKEFDQKQWKLVPETFAGIGLFSMIYGFPLQFHPIAKEHLQRFRLLFKSNNADICPVIGDTKPVGPLYNMYIGRTGQLFGYDLYQSENYNVLAVGGSGAGKSFTEADNQIGLLAAGFKVVVVDIGESYKFPNIIIGGTYIQVSEEGDTCFNFFTNIISNTVVKEGGGEVEVVHEDELNTIVPLIGMMASLDLRASSSENSHDPRSNLALAYLSGVIEKAVNMAFQSRGKDAGMREVYEALADIERSEKETGANTEEIHRLMWALEPYGNPTGKRYRYFNGPNTINLESDYIVLELEELLGKGELLYVALMAVSQRVAVDFWFNRSRKKAFVADEFWRYGKLPIMALFMEELYRRIRKYNGSAKAISQSVYDFHQGLYANADWLFLLKQDPTMVGLARDEKKIVVTDFEASLIESVSPKFKVGYGEVMIKNKGGSTLMSRVVLDPFGQTICGTTRADDRTDFLNTMKKYDLDALNTARLIAVTKEKKITKDAALAEIKKIMEREGRQKTTPEEDQEDDA